MNWQDLLDPAIQNFITQHRRSDVAALALKKPPHADWPYIHILDQIKARQKLDKKSGDFMDHPSIILPHPDVIEQASSRACALYKASLAAGQSMADLTAGSGADTIALAQNLRAQGHAVEQDPVRAAILAHNLKILGLDHIQVHATSAENFVRIMPPTDTVFIDPQRRSGEKRGLISLHDTSPDIAALWPDLRQKAQRVILKTSPVLDITQTLARFPAICAVHIVQYQKECKELLFIFSPNHHAKADEDVKNIPIHAVSIDDNGQVLQRLDFTAAEEAASAADFSAPQAYLYEPAPAFQKSGAFKLMAQRYDLKKLHPNTHLYTADHLQDDFPGRIFNVIATCAVDKKALKTLLPSMKANISTRNFNLPPDSLRKKLGLSDGGEITIFASAVSEHGNVLILCIKNQTD